DGAVFLRSVHWNRFTLEVTFCAVASPLMPGVMFCRPDWALGSGATQVCTKLAAPSDGGTTVMVASASRDATPIARELRMRARRVGCCIVVLSFAKCLIRGKPPPERGGGFRNSTLCSES